MNRRHFFRTIVGTAALLWTTGIKPIRVDYDPWVKAFSTGEITTYVGFEFINSSEL